ncbi:DEAD/DEAH box helicase [Actinomyces sp. B33]|uniref:DEAD/DEAH box helicase n=1 Tax=Actinomyces sp. B33 TaxID=2942131 RepID=UPI0023403EF4|nr:DEAD/DEAH box helicase [Actinomyces sp. B33]MDC4233367.1 DEAD/DEAH box helicase [Actinomyces sp. B33]
MPENPELAESLRTAEDAALMAQVGPATWARGLTLWRAGAVVETQWGTGGQVIGRVRDSGLAYKTWIAPGQGRFEMTCACPIGADCAHAVAAALTMRESLRDARPVAAWKASLSRLVGAGGTGSGEPLALLVDAHDPDQPTWLTPLRPGTRVAWTEKRAAWPDLTSAQWESVVDGLNATHLALIREGYRISRENRDWLSPGEVSLQSLGEQAIGWLTRLARSGVLLLAGTDPLTPLVLDHSTWDIDLDARAAGDGLVLAPIARNGEAIVARPRIDARARALILDGGTRLARINGLSLLDELPPGGIEIPAEDMAEFRTRWLPALRRRIGIVSLDSSADSLAEAPARLVATVRVDGVHSVTVRWWAEFDFSGTRSRLPLAEAAHDEDVAAIAARIDALGRERAPEGLWRPGPQTLRAPAWRAPEILSRLVPALDDPGLIWDVADEVGRIRVDDDALRVVARVDDSTTDWFDLRISISVDGRDVPLADVLAALARGDDHLLVDRTWVRLDGERIQRLRDLLDEAALLDDADDAPRINVLHLGLWEEFVENADIVEAAASWRSRLDALTGPSRPLPTGPCRAVLRPYQAEGREWLIRRASLGLGGILADDMGLGKTLQMLSAISALRADGADRSEEPPVLVVAPTSVVGTWKQEADRFFPGLRVRAVTETSKRRGEDLDSVCERADVVVTSYTVLRLDADDWTSRSFSGLVVDEAQNAKNPRTAIHRALTRIRAPWCFGVTGTPVENSLADLWAVLSFCSPGLLPRWKSFNDAIRRPIEQDGDADALARLHRLTAPFILRRSKEDVARDLPDKIETVLEIDLGEEHRRIYDQYLTRERVTILSLMEDFRRRRIDVLASITRLRQLALDPALVDESYAHVGAAKAEYLADQLDQIVPRGHQALVFSQFTSFLARIRAVLERRGLSVVQLDGSTRDRARVIDEFRSGRAQVFLISLKAGGTGLTLTEADYVYVMDPWWNPAAEEQAVDRAHRIGQTKKVNVYRLVAARTIEEKVLALQERKRRLVTSVVDGDGATGAPIDVDDLRALIEG